ncbi:MAG: TrkH family potassium uptake protein [Desulfobacterales bacterium]|jgi:trk system potassium uptake protein TrkH|nr:TrkH family potassium uptake protein [Desulfobacterales bacterium]
MRWRYVLNVIGLLTLFSGLTMLAPLGVGVFFADASVIPLLVSIGITVLFGLILHLAFRRVRVEVLSPREAMAIVALGWVAIGALGALPFLLGIDLMPVDAVFEAVSGFTTTGSTILTDIESVPKGLLFWRSQIQWLGGMGIIVLSIAILPFLKLGGMQLYKAEVPSPVPDRLRPHIRDTAMVLWKVYAAFTLLQVLLLMIGGMDLFDAFCHAFTTMPTGGYSTWNASIAHFDSLYLDLVFIAFMLIAGINFSLHYLLVRGQPLAFWRDTECRFFLALVLVLTAVVAWDIHGTVYASLGEALRFAAFQVVSIVTTTGYATADYELWPGASQLILLLCMFVGASAGSTAGGMKCLRVIVALKYCYRELFLLLHPHAVSRIKLSGKPVSEDVVRSVIGFLALYVGIFAAGILLVALTGVDFTTSMAAVATTLGNVGPGFGTVGPTENFAHIPEAAKWILIWCMLLGRLEIYTVLILFVPEFYRK